MSQKYEFTFTCSPSAALNHTISGIESMSVFRYAPVTYESAWYFARSTTCPNSNTAHAGVSGAGHSASTSAKSSSFHSAMSSRETTSARP